MAMFSHETLIGAVFVLAFGLQLKHFILSSPRRRPDLLKTVLPNEILLNIFELLPLQSLIVVRGVSRLWRDLVEVAHIDPTRRSLLDLYLDVIQSPAFQLSRHEVIQQLNECDHPPGAYFVARVEASSRWRLPDEIRMWFREWPTRAIFLWMWPAFPAIPSPSGVFAGTQNLVCRRKRVWMHLDFEMSDGSNPNLGAVYLLGHDFNSDMIVYAHGGERTQTSNNMLLLSWDDRLFPLPGGFIDFLRGQLKQLDEGVSERGLLKERITSVYDRFMYEAS
ncbi:unnamed protein product [Somion occarium]|uniref:F-box domain-containing protein n=1 Tax=Somion occarium TaxID=3059160 RepID=A0ABP1CSJ1_9APHY